MLRADDAGPDNTGLDNTGLDDTEIIAWSYSAPLPGMEPLAGLIAFYQERTMLRVEDPGSGTHAPGDAVVALP